jgi:hypothetical protein
MSVWTHVAAVFRIDGVKEGYLGGKFNGRHVIDWDKITGRAIYDGDWCSDDDYEQQCMRRDWDAYREHPDRFMPTGSEGSLQRLLWVNPKKYCAARYTVTVFGDLRDYEDHEAIKEWFYGVCDKCHIRQATCTCNVSGPVYTWTYGEEE